MHRSSFYRVGLVFLSLMNYVRIVEYLCIDSLSILSMHLIFILVWSAYVVCAKARTQFFAMAAGAACAR